MIPSIYLLVLASSALDCKIELVQVQDYGGSTGLIIDALRDSENYVGSIVSEIGFKANSVPSIKFGVTSFVDKPLPFVGFGWGDKKDSVDKNWCYRNELPLTDIFTKGDILSTLASLPDSANGNDYPGNQFEGLIATMVDPSVGWSDDIVHPDGSILLKYAVLVTGAPAHGVNLSGQLKLAEVEHYADVLWPIGAHLEGSDLRQALEDYNYSWGREAMIYNSRKGVKPTNMKSLKSQFIGSQFCEPDSDAFQSYTYLSGVSHEKMSQEERDLWENIKIWCGPANIYHSIGIESSAGILESQAQYSNDEFQQLEDGTGICLIGEYPNQQTVQDVARTQNIKTLVLLPLEYDDVLTPWMEFAFGRCRGEGGSSSIYDCLRDFYYAALPDSLVTGAKMFGSDINTEVPKAIGSMIAYDMIEHGCTKILDNTSTNRWSPPPVKVIQDPICPDTSNHCHTLVTWIGSCTSDSSIDFDLHPSDNR
eukprot:GHVH01013412.1.p1 GENE.GHVH01013412.1~~GHVH01013412.1.p1  ORF type:complete len:479 (-),score=59.74 GHVH01013412.1:117-1553(-)